MISAIQKLLELLIVKDQQNSPTVTVGLGWLWPGYLDPDACWGEVEVIEAGVCSIVFLHLVNKLSKETESDQRSDILRAEVSEIGIFLVERRFHFQRQTSHDVLDLLLSEGYIVRVFEVKGRRAKSWLISLP